MNKVKPTHGGKRAGAGRPSNGYKMVSIRMTEAEKLAVKDFLKKLRQTE